MMLQDVNILEELFLSTDMWGYLGPIALVVIGYYLMKQDYTLGLLWFIVEALFIGKYIELLETSPAYAWHIMILLLGVLFTCLFPLMDRRF